MILSPADPEPLIGQEERQPQPDIGLFAIGGTDYEIDLGKRHASGFGR